MHHQRCTLSITRGRCSIDFCNRAMQRINELAYAPRCLAGNKPGPIAVFPQGFRRDVSYRKLKNTIPLIAPAYKPCFCLQFALITQGYELRFPSSILRMPLYTAQINHFTNVWQKVISCKVSRNNRIAHRSILSCGRAFAFLNELWSLIRIINHDEGLHQGLRSWLFKVNLRHAAFRNSQSMMLRIGICRRNVKDQRVLYLVKFSNKRIDN